MLFSYLKTAFRNLRRNRIYSFINIAGLSLGLACAMLIMLYVKDELSYDRFHKNAHQVYRIGRLLVQPDGSIIHSDGYTGSVQGPRFTANIPEIHSFVRVRNVQKDLKNGATVSSQQVLYVDSNFFSTFSFDLLKGDPLTVLVQPNSVVISEDMARSQFGTIDAVDKTILLKDGEEFRPYLVTGVSKNCPQNSSLKFQILLPIRVTAADERDGEAWLNSFLNTFVFLNKDADIKSVERKIKNVYEREAGESIKIARQQYNLKWTPRYKLQPLLDMHLSKEFPAIDGLTDASDPVFSYILSGIAIFILIIACINFINLTVARSVKRAKEIGIRKVVGGNRNQLILQFLGESIVLCFFAFVIAIVMAQLALPVFNKISGKELSISYLFDIKLVAGYITLFIITALLAGSYPALVLSDYNPVQTLYGRFLIKGKNYLQKSLVVLQFALASFLIIATLIVFSQFKFLTTENLGYNDKDLAITYKTDLTRKEAALFKEELMKTPYYTGAAPKNAYWSNTGAKLDNGNEIGFVYETIDESYIPLLNIPIIKGRNFSPDFPSDSSHSVIVNETFVKTAGWENPIGKNVNFFIHGKKTYTVIGVVKDHHFQSLHEKIKPQLFAMKPSNAYGSFYVKIKPEYITAGIQKLESVFKNLFPLSPYSYRFKDVENRRNYEAEEKWKQIMLFASVLNIFISCFGLFGLSVLSAEKRLKEIGIRKVLGASVSGIALILSKDFMKLVTVALLIAMPIVWIAASSWLENYPFHITLSWWMFASAALLVVLLAVTTVSFQAIKAGFANPVKSLRSE